jgi:hypothetical protein
MSATKKNAEPKAEVAENATTAPAEPEVVKDDEPMVFEPLDAEDTVEEAPKAAQKVVSEEQKRADAVLAAKILSGADPEASNANGGAGGRATIDEMLHSYFSPTELVRIKNPFTHDTGWAYSDPKDIKIEQPSAETRRVYGIGKGFQKVRIIHSGEDIVIAGWEAYVGLTRMFKAWVQEMDDVRNMNNTLTFKKFMDIAYLGTFDPNAGKNMPTILSPEEELEADLGLI